MFFLDEDARQFSLPVGWTDAAEPDAFVTMAAGRSPFRFTDLVEADPTWPPTAANGVEQVRQALWGAISAVFRSWNSPRAITYRGLHGYPSMHVGRSADRT